jgi:HD-GYP domain-containing protein (c-di-GMP phosphodiesterase class II)
MLAVRVGEELGLAPGRLRALAIGGLLHDMGKLQVPDAILNKPGKLDAAEFAVIRKHTLWGEELLDELGGFSQGVRRLVRDHHERLDGTGYPGRLPEEQLNLDTRIMTVCDVYDALISTRVYREAWTVERAVALLRAEIGQAFDGRCVASLERVLQKDGLLTLTETAATRGSASATVAGAAPLTAAA